MPYNPTTTDDLDADLDQLLRASRIGVPSYSTVVPGLIAEIQRLRNELRRDRFWQATRDAAILS